MHWEKQSNRNGFVLSLVRLSSSCAVRSEARIWSDFRLYLLNERLLNLKIGTSYKRAIVCCFAWIYFDTITSHKWYHLFDKRYKMWCMCVFFNRKLRFINFCHYQHKLCLVFCCLLALTTSTTVPLGILSQN